MTPLGRMYAIQETGSEKFLKERPGWGYTNDIDHDFTNKPRLWHVKGHAKTAMAYCTDRYSWDSRRAKFEIVAIYLSIRKPITRVPAIVGRAA